jgi:hypothetical protein
MERRRGDDWAPFGGSRSDAEVTWLHGTTAAGWPEAGCVGSRKK